MKNVQDIYPLSPMQQGLLFHTLYAPTSGVYFEQFHCTLSGELDVPAFKLAWQRVVDRHETLRSALLWEGLDEPLQVVRERVELPWDERDWRGLSAAEQGARYDALLEADRRRGFQLSRAPLMRMALIQVADDAWRLVWSFHHVLFDGWSVPILLREVITLYEGLRRGFEPPLDRPRPYRDYIAWLQRQDAGRAEEFWRKTLKGFSAPTRLGVERTSIAGLRTGKDYERQVVRLSRELTSGIQELARQTQLSLNSFVQGAWALLLSRYSGDEDVVFGATSSGRPPQLPGVESMVGLFVNSLPVRVRVSPDSYVLPWLQELQARQAEVRQFEYSSLMSVQSWSDVPRGEPLFDSLFVFENYPLGRSTEQSETKLVVQEIGTWSRTSFGLTVIAGAPSDALSVGIAYEPSRFDDETVARMVGHVGNLLKAMATTPESQLSELSLLEEQERIQVTVSFPRAVAASRGAGTSVPRRFETQVEATPDAVAVAWNDCFFSYRTLNARANHLANRLRALDVGPDVAVAVCLERSPEAVIGILSILKAGGAYVPLDPDYPPERLSFMLEDARAAVVLSVSPLAERLPEHDAELVCLDTDWAEVAGCPEANLEGLGDDDNLTYVMYTSGSTGKPKGVSMPRRALVNLLEWQSGVSSVGESARTLQFASLSFDVSFQEMFSTLCSGGTLVLIGEDVRRDAVRLRRTLDMQAIHRLFVPFVALQQLAETEADPEPVVRSLSEIVTAGEQLQITAGLARWMNQLENGVLHNHYGPTESHVVSAHTLTGAPTAWPPLPPIGRPISNAELYVLDHEFHATPIGVPGELHIGGLCLARGYHARPNLTAEKFVPHPSSESAGARLYKTGDLARWQADGNLEFLGRVDGQVKVRGFRVELGEIEALLAAHPAVQQAVVLAREDRPGHRRLVAYLVVDVEHEQGPVGTAELRRFVQAKLPDYMVPSVFVVRDALPRTPSGKVDRRALPAPEAIRPELESEFVAPRTPVEKALARIWAEVLGVDRVGVHDNFFELGGDSILSIQVVTRASQSEVRLTPAELFQHPTIAQLASVVGAVDRLATEQGPVSGDVPLTPIQHWLMEQELPDPHHWNMALLLELRRKLDARPLDLAIRDLVVHHDALRLRFERTTTGWRQRNARVEEAFERVFVHVDLSGLPSASQRTALEATARELQSSLNLSAGPLLRIALFDRGDAWDRLMLVMHHLVVDGVSWRILLQDLLVSYEQRRLGQVPKLLAKTTSFKRWAERLVELAQSDALAGEADFWRGLALKETPKLPVDHPDGVNDAGSTDAVVVSLEGAETKALLQEVPKAYRTQINDVLLTALVQTFGRWIGRPTLLFDLEGHGREELFEDVDLSRTVGWFTAMFPVRLELAEARGSSDPSPGEALKSVKNQLRRIPQRGVGYGILRYLSKDEELTARLRSISPEVSFNYLGQFDQALPESAPVGLAPESRGSSASLVGRRVHLLDVSGGVGGGQLHMTFMYSRNVFERATIERLARSFVASLRSLIAHCQSPEAGGCTPSDFPLVTIEQATLDALVGKGREVEDIYPVSPLQSGLLFHSLYSPGSWEYFEQLSCTLEAQDFQVDAFKRAWDRVVERHAILRTRLAWAGLSTPVQVVQRQVQLPWDERDWRGKSEEEQQDELKELLRTDRQRGFDLDRAPLMRMALIRLADDAWRLIWSHHHLLLDGWSLQVLLREVTLFYMGSVAGQEFPLERPRPFRDYIAWLVRQDRTEAETYWQKTLSGFTAPTRLEVERAPTVEPLTNDEDSYGSREVRVSREVTLRLDALARRHQLTLNTLVQGAWALLLSRYSAERDVVFGVTVSGRSASLPGIESMLGLFINTLPARVRVEEDSELVPWLAELQDRQVELQGYEHSSLVDVHGWSNVPGGEPLFETLMVFENYPVERSLAQQPAGSLAVRDVSFPQRTNYPITLVAVPRSGLLLRIMYDGSRFDAPTISQMLGHLETLLERFAETKTLRLSDVPMLSEPERRQVVLEWNDTRRSFPRDRCLHELFQEQARALPEAIALVEGSRQMTYRCLDQRSNQLARVLRAEGVEADVRVGIAMDRSFDLVVGVLGILKAGGAYVPLDPELPSSRLAFIAEDSRLALVLTERAHRESMERAHLTHLLCLDRKGYRVSDHELSALAPTADPENLAYVMYTSGSTGQPKGVEVPHRAVVRLGYGLRDVQLGPEHTLAHVSTPSFDASTFEMWGALLHGARLVLCRPSVPEPTALERLIGQHRIDTMWLTSTLFNTVVEQAPRALAPVKQLLVGGEALSAPHVRQAQKQFPSTRWFNGYGPTENTTFTCCSPIPSPLGRNSTVTLGGPIGNTEVYVLDDYLRPQPVGVPGELYIGGEGLARGYSGYGHLTAEKFVPHPFSEAPGHRLYRSGDRCRWDAQGSLEFLGRLDDQVKLRGYRVELGEIEATLRQHPAVRDCAVTTLRRSVNDTKLAAYVELSEESNPGQPHAGELMSFLETRLPRYMLPASFHFVTQMPLTTSGKVDRRTLSRMEGGRETRPLRQAYAAPRTPVEAELARHWSELLAVERVGVHDNFFELGGHSLIAMQLVSRLRETFQVDVPLRELFDAPTIAELATKLRRATSQSALPPIVPVPREQPLPLSFGQQRLWFLDQLMPGNAFYSVPQAVRLTGPLNVPVLKRTFDEIVDRHEALRTTFETKEGLPVQVVSPPGRTAVPLVDLSDLLPVEREREARRLAAREAERGFDLLSGPLLRIQLLRLAERDHVVLLNAHHIVCDAWSLTVLLQEMSLLYPAFSFGMASPLPELPVQYADFAHWQRQWLAGQALRDELTYWKERLADYHLLELPTDRPRPAMQTYRGARHSQALSPDLVDAFQGVGRDAGATAFMTSLAAFQVLLARYSGQHDILVGSPIANRPRPEVEGVVGFFLNTLALRVDLSGDPTFRETLERVRRSTLEAYEHMDLPFELLVEELVPDRDLSREPLIQVLFVMFSPQQTSLPESRLPGELALAPFPMEAKTSKFDLTWFLSGHGSSVEYNVDLFDRATVTRMGGHLRRLMEAVVADPDQRLSELPILTRAERQQLLEDWSHPQSTSFPVDASVQDLFELAVDGVPDAIALIFGARQLTYAALAERVEQLSRHLRALGVGPDSRVGICLERSLEMIVALLAVLEAGGAYVPLDPAYPVDRLAFMLEDARVSVLLTVHGLSDRVARSSARPVYLDDEWCAPPSNGTGAISSDATPDNLAYVIYTSGSSGIPKGVAMSHRALVNLIRWQIPTSKAADNARTLQFAPLSFDVSFQEILSTLCSRGTLVGITEECRRDPVELSRSLDRDQIERLFVPFVALQQMAEAARNARFAPGSLQEIITAGEQLYLTPAIEWLMRERPDCELQNHYGPTESHVVTALALRGSPHEASPLPPIGRPIWNTSVYALDRNFNPVPAHVPGELFIAGLAVARGYLGRPRLSAERFLPDPFSERAGARMYATGDRVRWLFDGNLEFLGRTDDQVKVRGFRIEPAEVEAALGLHPAVRQAAVVARRDPRNNNELVAYVVLEEGAAEGSTGASDLRRHLSSHVPDHLVPTSFVFLNTLPLTPSGKVDRRRLPAPGRSRPDGDRSLVAPRTPLEAELARLWSDVLGVEPIGVHDDFFELGGHSLLATQLVSRLRDRFEVELPLRELFDARTVASLATVVEGAKRHIVTPPIERVARDAKLPLSFAQQRLWFLDRLIPGQAFYNLPGAVRLKGELDVLALRRTFNEIVRRHEVLRTSFKVLEGQPVQVIAPHLDLKVPLIDLSSLSARSREVATKRLTRAEAVRPFDLSRGPLLRVSLLRLGELEHVALLTMHHIVSDGWSRGVLTREVATLYYAFHRGLESPLPDLEIQYADFASWQRRWIVGDVLEQEIDYWSRQLEGMSALELPVDRSRPPVQTFRGATHTFRFPQSLASRLEHLQSRQNYTDFMILLAAFQTLLTRYTGQTDIPVGSPIANRTRSETEALIGFFVNTLVLRNDLSGNPSFRELLERTRPVCLDAYAHQDLPFEKLVDAVQPDRDMSRHPLVQVMFALQNAPMPAVELPGGDLTLEIIETESQSAKFDLLVSMSSGPAGLFGLVEYSTDLFDSSTITRMFGHFETLLNGIATHPEARLWELPLLSDAERHQLVVSWSGAGWNLSAPGSIHEMFEEQAERTPDRIALVWEHEKLTYEELNLRANRVAQWLVRKGVGPEIRVGVCLDRSLEMVIGLLGVLKAGGAYVPIDPTYPIDRITFIVGDASVATILTSAETDKILPESAAQRIRIDAVHTAQEVAATLPNRADATNIAYVIYTSGSTGRPKGVAITHENATALLRWSHDVFGESRLDGTLAATSISFDLSVFEIFAPLTCGGRAVVAQNALQLPELVAASEVSTVNTVPSVMAEILRAGELPSSVRTVNLAGEPLASSLVEKLYELSGVEAVYDLYGPSEDTTYSTFVRRRPGGPYTIGRPVTGKKAYLLDREWNAVPLGVRGELSLAGKGVSRGYLGRPSLTAERFIPDPFAEELGGRLYKTGDSARWLTDGQLEFQGRLDNQVKLRGYRIELGEIEAILSEHASVREAVVVVHSEPSGRRRLVGYVVMQSHGSDDAENVSTQLQTFLRERIPEFMVPTEFVALEALPLTPNGKVDRRALPAPDQRRASRKDTYLAPRTPEEEKLARIWSEVLGIERVGVNDNFFQLGGDSILTIQIVSQAQQEHLAITPQQLFQHQTIAELALVAGTRIPVQAEQGEVTGPVPLTPIEHWFFAEDNPEPHYFNQTLFLHLRRNLEMPHLNAAVSALVAHHDALRLRARRDGLAWRQHIAPFHRGREQVFVSVDLTTLNEAGTRRALEAVAARLQASLDLMAGPILRVAHFKLGDGSERILFVIHHIAVDGVSWRVLLQDLLTSYQQSLAGRSIRLPAKTTSIQRWARLLLEHADSEHLQAEIPYWTSVCRSATPLPTDYAGDNDLASTATVAVTLDAALTQSLLFEVPGAYRTQVNDVLLTALVRAFAQWTSRSSLLVNLEGHGREDLFEGVDLTRTVGWFTTIFPVRLGLSEDPDPGASLMLIKEQLRAVPQKGIGYGVLRYLGKDTNLSTQLASEAEVSFNYLGRLDQAVPDELPLTLAEESSGSPRSLKGTRSHLIDVSGAIAGGCLRMAFAYSRSNFDNDTIQRLATSYIESLEKLIAHCLQADAGGCTPSDFPLAGLDQTQLEHIVGKGREIEDIYPTTPVQAGLLFHSLYAPELGEYFEQISLTAEGELDGDALKRSWQSAVDRLAVLRTGFVWEGLPEPLQLVHRRATIPWTELDWQGRSDAEQRVALESFLADDRRRGFELRQPPLMRFALIRLSERTWKFVWSFHHALLDGWSMSLLLKDVMLAYQGFTRGIEVPLEPPRPYRDYIEWLVQQDRDEAEAYWRETLRGFTAPTRLVTERSTGKLQSGEPDFDGVALSVPADLTAALHSMAREHRLNLSTVVEGAWSLLLSRYSGEEDVVFGAGSSGRPPAIPGIETMLGFFMSVLPVRARMSPDSSALEWFSAHQARQAGQREYEYSSLIDIKNWSDVPRGQPLFEIAFVFENYPVDRSLTGSGPTGSGPVGPLQIRDVLVRERFNYVLTLMASGLAQEVSLRVMYDRRRYEPTTVSRMVRHLRVLLGGIAARPEARLYELPLLTDEEREQIRGTWSQAETEAPGELCVHDLVEETAGRIPDTIAVTFGSQSMSYRELEERANQLAHYLRGSGIGPEGRVAIFVDRSPDMVVGALGVLKAGGAYVPLDPSTPKDRLEYLLKDCAAAALLTTGELAEGLPDTDAMQVRMDVDWERIAQEDKGSLPRVATTQNLAYVIYTSGSTGRPKGVSITHRGLANLVHWHRTQYRVDASDRATQLAGLSFDASVWEVWPYLTAGACLHLVDERTRSSPARLVAWLLEESITLTFLPTPLAEAVLSEPWPKEVPLRGVLTGGDQLHRPPEESLPFSLWNHYGPTEDTVVTTQAVVARDGERPPPIGQPIRNKRAYVLDEHGSQVPVGLIGELCIAGVGLARGYLGRPEWTAERFVSDPYSERPGSRLYRTGDLVRWNSDGQLEFMGRGDQQVKIRGFRVELGEVEAVLAEESSVSQSAVTCRVEPSGQRRLIGYVVRDRGKGTSIQDVREYLRRKLPEHMIPTQIVELDRFPMTPSGKVDRRSLPEVESTREELASPYVAPRNALEESIARLWSEVLMVERVGIHDNFFELGGHSLSALRLIAEMSQQGDGRSFTLPDLFARPTIAQIVGSVSEPKHPSARSCLVPLRERGSRPPLFFAHGGGGQVLSYAALARELDAQQPFFGLQPAEGEWARSVEELAALYVEAARSQQAHGPYFVGGHSFGGVVAFEMAAQLTAAGEEVALLAVLDMVPPSLLDERAMKILLRKEVERVENAAHEHTADQLHRRLSQQVQHQLKALLDYRPTRLRGRVTLFRAKETYSLYSQEATADSTLGWDGLAEDATDVHVVPGDHFSMLSEPNVRSLAREIQLCLNDHAD